MRSPARGAALVALIVALAAVAGPALAADDPTTGYWTKLRAGLPVPVQPPDPVPEGGSWVSADPTGPVAVSALRAEADPGNAIVGLRLPIGSAAGPTAVVLCPTLDGWVPEQGGRLEAAPPADCSEPVPSTVEEDVLVVDLPLALQGDSVDLLLAPADGSAFSLTLQRATAEALVQQPATADDEGPLPPLDQGGDGASTGGFDTGSGGAFGGGFDSGFGGGSSDPLGLGGALPPSDPLLAAPVLPEQAEVQGGPPPQTAPAPVALVRRPPAVVDEGPVALLAAALLAMLAALAVRLALQPAPAPRRLGGVARLHQGDNPLAAGPTVAAPARGVGRFRAVRTRPPVRI